MADEVIRRRVQVDCGGKSRTEQHHKAACDVNNILKKYYKTGLLQQRLSQGVYGDFTSIVDYQTCVNKLQDAHGDFAALPAKIRKRFDNDPGKLIDFVSREENRDEAIELGMIPKPPEVPVPPAEPPAEPES